MYSKADEVIDLSEDGKLKYVSSLTVILNLFLRPLLLHTAQGSVISNFPKFLFFFFQNL